MKHYQIQLGKAKAETVTQEQLDALKKQHGTRFSNYDVKEVEAPTVPKDVASPAGTRRAASNQSE